MATWEIPFFITLFFPSFYLLVCSFMFNEEKELFKLITLVGGFFMMLIPINALHSLLSLSSVTSSTLTKHITVTYKIVMFSGLFVIALAVVVLLLKQFGFFKEAVKDGSEET